METKIIWDAFKAPARNILLFIYSFGINWAFVFIAESIGFEFAEDQKLQLIGYGDLIVFSILSAVDRLMHQTGKVIDKTSTKKIDEVSVLTGGIARF